MNKSKAKILFYDLETSPLKAWVWSTGKQYVGHKQLVEDRNRYGIICVTYCWNDNKPAQSIDWGYEEQDTGALVEKFDRILKEADHVIGKNNKRFDDKMLNAARLFAGLPGYPEWAKYTDDLEQHMRKNFRVPSQSLDYYSAQFGLGGKIKMEMQDWIDIVEKNKNGRKALDKMLKYGKKDVVDTRKLWNIMSSHFEPKFNKAVFDGVEGGCKNCGSANLLNNGQKVSGGIKYQQYNCRDCGRYAGRRAVARLGGKLL